MTTKTPIWGHPSPPVLIHRHPSPLISGDGSQNVSVSSDRTNAIRLPFRGPLAAVVPQLGAGDRFFSISQTATSIYRKNDHRHPAKSGDGYSNHPRGNPHGNWKSNLRIKRQNTAALGRRREFNFLDTAALTNGELGRYSNLSESGWASLIFDSAHMRH